MPTKRDILTQLTRDELLANVDYYELEVDDRRVRDDLIEALAKSRKARLDEILEDLPRDRLKALCRTFGLSDAGSAKAPIVDRLLGRGTASEEPDPPESERSAPEPAASPLPLTRRLDVDRLERYLWSAADILRGSIDSGDYKNYIFGLLFLKRLSDRFEEEAEKLIAEWMAVDVARTDPDAPVLRLRLRALGRFPEDGHERRRNAQLFYESRLPELQYHRADARPRLQSSSSEYTMAVSFPTWLSRYE